MWKLPYGLLLPLPPLRQWRGSSGGPLTAPLPSGEPAPLPLPHSALLLPPPLLQSVLTHHGLLHPSPPLPMLCCVRTSLNARVCHPTPAGQQRQMQRTGSLLQAHDGLQQEPALQQEQEQLREQEQRQLQGQRRQPQQLGRRQQGRGWAWRRFQRDCGRWGMSCFPRARSAGNQSGRCGRKVAFWRSGTPSPRGR